MLEEALNFKLQIQNKYLDKGIGYYHNIYYNKLWTTNDSSLTDPGEDFILWSTPTHIGIETFIYNVQNKYILKYVLFTNGMVVARRMKMKIKTNMYLLRFFSVTINRLILLSLTKVLLKSGLNFAVR